MRGRPLILDVQGGIMDCPKCGLRLRLVWGTYEGKTADYMLCKCGYIELYPTKTIRFPKIELTEKT